MTLLGQTREDLPFTVCDKFQPTVLEGQLCYSIDMSFIHTEKSKAFKNSYGLLLLLDPGKLEGIKEKVTNQGPEKKIVSLNLDPSDTYDNSASISINTLQRFTDYRAGSYGLSVLKKMIGTDSFLALPNNIKNCQVETFEECQAQRYLEEVWKECGCVPWALGRAMNDMVNMFM